MLIVLKFTLPIVAALSIVSCLQQSNPGAAAETRTEADDEIQQRKLLANFSLASFLPPVSKITLPKLPSIPKRNTITLTTTVLTQETKVVVIHPTCIKLRNIHSVCDGVLETIAPTPILVPHWKSTESDTDLEMMERQAILPSSTVSIQPTQTVEIDDSPRKNIIEPSEHEYEYNPSPYDPTSELDPETEPRQISSFLDSILGPKYKIVTEYLTVTKVLQYTDLSQTATVIAENCLPPNVKYPLCDIEHLQPLLQRLQKRKKTEAAKKTVSKVYDQVNKFVMSNPYGLLGISPDHIENQLYGALNSNGIPSLLRTAEQFPMFRSMRERPKTTFS